MPELIQYHVSETNDLTKENLLNGNRLTLKTDTLFPQAITSPKVRIHQRRYLGCKVGVLDLISHIVWSYIKKTCPSPDYYKKTFD